MSGFRVLSPRMTTNFGRRRRQFEPQYISPCLGDGETRVIRLRLPIANAV